MIEKVFPFFGWFRSYGGEQFKADFISGLTVALVLIPQSMAYAQLAGLPSYYGLYASFLPPMIAALFGSSRQLATGPVAVVSLMTSASLAPLATAGSGYLNFMGNEFGHPEWVDFPRPGNNWSYHYARRQWHLLDAPDLKYRFLAQFDREMIGLARGHRILETGTPHLHYEHVEDKIIAFERAGLLFVFNFHPTRSRADYPVDAPPGTYRMILDSDASPFGGKGRLAADQVHFTRPAGDTNHPKNQLSLYLPNRTAVVLARGEG